MGAAIPFPHQFDSFRENASNSLWVIGAGLSYGIVPLADKLIIKNQSLAETTLGIRAIEDLPDGADALYVWADKALNQLDDTGGIPKKLKLAKALNILSDSTWTQTDDFRTTAKKHRVLARFMMEGLCDTIWSLNWDCHLENAMESIGFKEGGKRRGIIWGAGYYKIITDEDFDEHMGDNELRKVVKPHGCVKALKLAEKLADNGDFAKAEALANRFMITEAELGNVRDNALDRKFNNQIISKIQTGSLVAVGWAIGEPNWRNIIASGRADRTTAPSVGDLSIIDPFFNDAGHALITSHYHLTQQTVHFEISTDSENFCADTFFLWLQAKYVLDQLIEHGFNSIAGQLNEINRLVDEQPIHHFMYIYADEFIPSWLRLCWRGGVMQHVRINPSDLQRRDDHILIRTPQYQRPDLKASASLLNALVNSGVEWDLMSFSGALYDEEHLKLIIPIPIWNGEFDGMSSIKPLMDGFELMGMVQSLDILPLTNNAIDLSEEKVMDIKLQVAQANSYFQVDDIGIARDLLALIEVDDE